MTKALRDQALLRWQDAQASYARALAVSDSRPYRPTFGEWQRAATALQESFDAYLEALPRVLVGRCPFCDKPSYRALDPHGLDGPFWRRDTVLEEPLPCAHFVGYLGAIHYGEGRPVGGGFEAHPGPEVPYVSSRLLEVPDVVAVVGTFAMSSGWTAYPVAYYARRRPPPAQRPAPWGRSEALFERDSEHTGCRLADESWDFDLEPWIATGKLRWTEPRQGLLRPVGEACPYADLPGVRGPVVVLGDDAWVEGGDAPAHWRRE